MEQISDKTRQLIKLIGAPNPEIEALCREVGEKLHFDTVVVSLLDEVRQWFQYRSGIVKADSTDVCWAFCAQTIREARFFEVANAPRDGRYARNALVTGDPHLVYYAGAPLRLEDGTMPGALALIDNKARPPLSQQGIDTLCDSAERVSAELERSLL
jgi:GAF domain-containing protein